MAFPIPPIASPAVAGSTDRAGVTGRIGQDRLTDGAAEGADGQGGFTKAVGDALSDLGRMEGAVEEASIKAATGDLSSVSDYMIAATEAQIATEITVAIRDRAITAFNDIMRMQI